MWYRNLTFVLVTALGLGAASAQQSVMVPATTTQISLTGTVTATTQIIAGVASKSIYVTAIGLIPVATSVVTFVTGTGTNCGTGTANVTGAMTFGAGQTFNVGNGNGALFVLPSGNSLCTTVATAVAPGYLSYSQF